MKVEFNPIDHSYMIGDKKLISVTTLLKKHGLAPDYTGVDTTVLEKAANKGTAVHEEIEDYIKCGYVGFTQEFEGFVNLCAELGFEPLESEVILPRGDYTEEEAENLVFAGTADIIGRIGNERVIVDVKTTAKVDKRYSWQTSLYERADGGKFDRHYIFHLREDKAESILLTPIADEKIDKLIECERSGQIYTESELLIPSDLLERALQAENKLAQIERAKKEADATAQEIRARLYEIMEQQGIASFETTNKAMLITRVAPTTKTSIDGTRLKKEHPEIAEEYTKISSVKGYIKINLREG